ncbi:MAG: extracellular solute-binding protein family 1 [Paenibacillus sp.]|jgi:multiple sugar transport system substrate-binding protein|uniref:ABC transporter substrate-binding protein n=1 Tax=Paenibacillus sp. GCM10012303 TaxID=3317340 RepID=UPI0029F2D286|nr:extracellular solute-binding protein family 1 [Paenibacillus sp.]
MNLTFKRTAAACSLAIMLGACSNGGTESNPGTAANPESVNPAVSEAGKEPAEVIFYSNNNDTVESFDNRFGDALRKKFPNYTIRYIQSQKGFTLPEMIASGTRFDIFFQSIGNFEGNAFPNGIQYDMTELLNRHKVDLGKFEPSIIESVRQASGGKLYGLPVFTNNLVLYYNKTLFDKFGVEYPKDGMTWDQLTELSKKMSRDDGGKTFYGYARSPDHLIRMNALSIPMADLNTDTPTINTDERWKTFMNSLVAPSQDALTMDYMNKTGKILGLEDFAVNQNVALFPYLASYVYVGQEQLKGLDWDMVSLPSLQPGIGSQSYPSYFGITNMAKNKDAAMEVLKYMVSEEFQSQLAKKGIMPVLQNADLQKQLGQESPFKAKNFSAMFFNKFAPIPPKALYDAQLVSVYLKYAQQAQIGKMDLNTALRSAEEEAKKTIADYKSKMK